MKLGYSEKKIRDWLIFEFGVIPVAVDVDRHIVQVDIRKRDLTRKGMTVEQVEEVLHEFIGREVKVRSVQSEEE